MVLQPMLGSRQVVGIFFFEDATGAGQDWGFRAGKMAGCWSGSFGVIDDGAGDVGGCFGVCLDV